MTQIKLKYNKKFMAKKRIVIGLVGATGSGKDTVAEHLEKKYKAKLMRFADPLKETLSIYFDKFSKEDQQWLANLFMQRFGKDILSRALRKRIDNGEGLILVNGIRFWEDFHFIKSYTRSYIIYIRVNQKLRWKRVRNRGEKTDDKVSFKKFQKIDKNETEKYVQKIGEKADFIIDNEKDLKYLLKKTDEAMEEINN